MRTIKFRGKSLYNYFEKAVGGYQVPKGTFVYGSLVLDCNKKPSIDVQGYSAEGMGFHTSYDVDADTVGQFTGLHDKNGKEIYEGDIIQGEYNHKHLVRYSDDEACFTVTLVEYVGNRYAERSNTGGVKQDWIDEFSKVVIGNIYDNPELMKGAKK